MGEPVPQEWLVGHRMAVDQEFARRVHDSGFSTAEWDLIMSVVSFELERPDDPESASLVPDAAELPKAVAAAEEIPRGHPGGAGAPPDRGTDGFLSRITDSLGIGDGSGRGSREERVREATTMVSEYAEVLQIHLKQRNAWTDLCERVDRAAD
ncbi:MAG: DUF5799 family protein [Halobacteriota archaeon]